jgi:hypothetical protein
MYGNGLINPTGIVQNLIGAFNILSQLARILAVYLIQPQQHR